MEPTNNDYRKGFLAGAIIGGLAGALSALLFAPKSGKELCKDLSEKSDGVYNKLADFKEIIQEKRKKRFHKKWLKWKEMATAEPVEVIDDDGDNRTQNSN